MRIAQHDAAKPADLFALRDALVTDDDAEVRAAALQRLDGEAARQLLPYIRDAVQDRSMLVREAAFVALARAEDAESLSRASYACQYDRGFRVRRTALLFAARTFGLKALPVLALASRDPFWRVRVTARRAAAALDATVDTRDVIAPFVDAAIPEAIDPDPAVVTARLQRLRGRMEPRDLVDALGHSHQALRRMAVTEISARGDQSVLYAVTRLLMDDRVPYAPAAAEATLARSAVRSATVGAQILERWDAEPAGPLAWALEAATRTPEWPSLVTLLTHQDARVRRAAVLRVPEAAPGRCVLLDTMASLLDDGDEPTRSRAAGWLARSASRDAKTILLQLDAPAQPTLVKSILVNLHAEARNADGVRSLLADAHGGIRAAAISALVALGDLTATERRTLEVDPDPWIRHAVLAPERASVAMADGSAIVRSAAFDAMNGEERAAWAESAAAEPDAGLRGRAASVLAPEATARSTVTLLRLARDADLGVRSIAVDALANRIAEVRSLLDAGTLQKGERIAAYTLLRLAGALPEEPRDEDAGALAHLALLDDVMHQRVPRVSTSPRPPMEHAPNAHWRRLGRTGIQVHPFGISGAHALDYADFARAYERGVNLFFWEPSHRELGRFLRTRAGTIVVAGTYHADAESIERDVVRALRTMKRDSIDVLLAFWTRSAARIEETRDVLQRLAGRGLVRAIGVSTHDRALACQAADDGFDVVMVRHSAAHRGAEASVFPHCLSRGTGVLTFSNLCYGRMLHRTPAVLSATVSAPDCYRYSLSQPGVGACIAAPRRYSELTENLAVVETPTLSEARVAELRSHGDYVYARSKAWSAETWTVAERPRPSGQPGMRGKREVLADWIDLPESIAEDVW
jgi:aryl-alcohol dehydrogenase-like predicted oxidoreductase/HEAT repeat protein